MDNQVNPLLLKVRSEVSAKIKRTFRPCKISRPEFVYLFQTRAQEVLLERKDQSFNFVIDDDNRPTLTMFWDYVSHSNPDTINSTAGIVLNGKLGCGKSVLMSALCRVLNDIKYFGNEECEEIHAIELAERIKLNGILPYARKPLLIQDMGKEPTSVNSFGTEINPVSNLLSIRAEYGCMTYGSTNLSTADFAIFYKDAKYGIAKRFTEHVNLIFLPGDSRRREYSINQPKQTTQNAEDK